MSYNKGNYIPVELIGVNWLFSIEWFDRGLNTIKPGQYHPKSVSVNTIKPFISKDLIFDLELYYWLWYDCFCNGVMLKPENAKLLLQIRQYIAKELFLAMPYTQTYIDNHYYTENWCFNSDLRCWFDQYLCINSGEHYMIYNKETFIKKHPAIIIGFDHMATPIWDHSTGQCIPLYEFQHWLPASVVNKLIDLYNDWCVDCNQEVSDAESMINNEHVADEKLKFHLIDIARKIKELCPEMEVFVYKSDKTELHYDLQKI